MTMIITKLREAKCSRHQVWIRNKTNQNHPVQTVSSNQSWIKKEKKKKKKVCAYAYVYAYVHACACMCVSE